MTDVEDRTAVESVPSPEPDPPRVAVPAAAPRRSLRSRLRRFTDLEGAPTYPVAVLFGLNLVDEFDRITFNTLTPELREAFDLRDAEIVAIGSLTAMFVLLAALPVGYIADRVNRVRFTQSAAVVWGLMTMVVAGAWAVPVLFAARFFGGIARSSNEVVHTTLLADYYEPRIHPKIFQLHRMANPLALVSALAAGGVAALAGWRMAFLVLAVPTFVLLVASVRLREPRRGETVDRQAAVAREGERPPGAWATARQLLRIRSLRRYWSGTFAIGIVLLTFSQLLSLFFEQVYDFGPAARGVTQFVMGVGTVIGMVIGGNAGVRVVRENRYDELPRLVAKGFGAFAVAVALVAFAPWWPLSMACLLVLGVAGGFAYPLTPSLIVRVVPPAIRAQAYSYTLISIGIGGLLGIPLAGLGESMGYRPTFVLIAIVFAPVSLIFFSAGRFVDADITAADDALRAVLPSVPIIEPAIDLRPPTVDPTEPAPPRPRRREPLRARPRTTGDPTGPGEGERP